MISDLFEQFSGPLLALWGPFLFLLLCAFGFPMPEDIILVVAGLLGAKYGYPFLLTAGITYCGIMIGDSCIYFLGSTVGRKFLKTRFGRYVISEKLRARAETQLIKHGVWVIFVARFIPGVRTAVFFTSGTLHFSFWKFFLMDGLAALISAPLFVYLGRVSWKLYEGNFEKLEGAVGEAKLYLGALVVALVLVGLLGFFVKRYLKKKGIE